MRWAPVALGLSIGGLAGCPAASSDDADVRDVPWKESNAEFRAREGRPPQVRGHGFVLDDSYKDPAIVEGLLRAYHERYPEITALVELGRTLAFRLVRAANTSATAPTRGSNDFEPPVTALTPRQTTTGAKGSPRLRACASARLPRCSSLPSTRERAP